MLSLLLDFGELEFGFEEVPAGLLFMSLDPGLLLDALPRPLTVTRSRTRRLPANELAMRFAVCFSLPVGTLPLSSMAVSVTFTLMVSLRSVGSFCSAVWIWLCKVELSVLDAPIEDALDGLAPAAPAFAPTAPAPAADCVELVLGAVAPVTPPVVPGVLLAEDWLVLVCPAILLEELAVAGADEAFSEAVGVVEVELLVVGVLLAVDWLVLGVLLAADWLVVLVCPAMLPEALALEGADEAFSELAGLAEAVAFVLAASPVVALLVVPGIAWVEAVAEPLGDTGCELLAPVALGVVALDC